MGECERKRERRELGCEKDRINRILMIDQILSICVRIQLDLKLTRSRVYVLSIICVRV